MTARRVAAAGTPPVRSVVPDSAVSSKTGPFRCRRAPKATSAQPAQVGTSSPASRVHPVQPLVSAPKPSGGSLVLPPTSLPSPTAAESEATCSQCPEGRFCAHFGSTKFEGEDALNATGVGACAPGYQCTSGVNTPSPDPLVKHEGNGSACPPGYACSDGKQLPCGFGALEAGPPFQRCLLP